MLMQQFHEAGCATVGIQESRHHHLIGQCNAWYHVLGHPASAQGTDGVQLWVSHSLPLYPGGPCIRKEHLRIVASDHNYLIAKLRLPEWQCVIITGRAPHSARPQAKVAGFWNAISSVLRRKAAGWPIIFCGDASAHVGECVTPAIGPLFPSQENQAGTLFHHWLLFAPATFEKWHQGQQHATFVSPGGDNAVRIGYIALPQDISFHTLNSWVETAIDLSISRTDHFAVLCRCAFSVTFSTASTQRHQ